MSEKFEVKHLGILIFALCGLTFLAGASLQFSASEKKYRAQNILLSKMADGHVYKVKVGSDGVWNIRTTNEYALDYVVTPSCTTMH